MDGLYREGEDDGLRLERTRTGCLGVMERLLGRRVHCKGGMSGVFLSFLIRSIEDPNCVRSCLVLPSWLMWNLDVRVDGVLLGIFALLSTFIYSYMSICRHGMAS